MRIETPDGKRMGSGTIISPDGHILTNSHVVEGYDRVSVLVQDSHTLRGYVFGYDEELDLAVVKIGGGPWPHLAISATRVAVGDEVYVIGYALDLPGKATVTGGLVSAIRPGTQLTWVQTDAAMNPGMSGGAVVTANGQFIGVPTWGYERAQNVGFFIALFGMSDEVPRLMAGARVALPKPSPTPRPTPTPGPPGRVTLRDLNATVESFRFFEGGDNDPPLEQRSYQQRFAKAATRFVRYELTLAHPAPDRRIDFELLVVVFSPPGGTMLGRERDHSYVDAGWTGSIHVGGWGWSTPGRWTVGWYEMTLVVGGQTAAVARFEVY